jgi:hypothetical protein
MFNYLFLAMEIILFWSIIEKGLYLPLILTLFAVGYIILSFTQESLIQGLLLILFTAVGLFVSFNYIWISSFTLCLILLGAIKISTQKYELNVNESLSSKSWQKFFGFGSGKVEGEEQSSLFYRIWAYGTVKRKKAYQITGFKL